MRNTPLCKSMGALPRFGLLHESEPRARVPRGMFKHLLPPRRSRRSLAYASCRVASHLLKRRRRSLGLGNARLNTLVSSELSEKARNLERLVVLGRELGRRDGVCPLCASAVDHEHFQQGMETALSLAKRLDAEAVLRATQELAHEVAKASFGLAEERLRLSIAQQSVAQSSIADYEQRCADATLPGSDINHITKEMSELEVERTSIARNLRILDAISVSRLLARAIEDEKSARDRISRAEMRLGRARLAEGRAKAIYDAARRAAAETLDQRLERVLPLMSELYKRMRPHPIWQDIEYSIRGDVRRFLKLRLVIRLIRSLFFRAASAGRQGWRSCCQSTYQLRGANGSRSCSTTRCNTLTTTEP